MSFPSHISKIFDAFGVPADTKAAVYDLYVSMGDEVLEVFSDIAEQLDPSTLRPEHCETIRARVVERYLTRNHPLWLNGQPTASFYHPRALEGRASGVAIPLGSLRPRMIGDDQPVPDGVLLQGRNAHYGGRQETISFDVVASNLADAIAIGNAAGQQHTLPGSIGETSGSVDAESMIALIWEVQPNVYKPTAERNRAISKVYRRHRNWHIVTLVAAIDWLRAKNFRIYVLKGEALSATHEVNAAKPVTPTIVDLHNRTVNRVASGLDLVLEDASRDDEMLLLGSDVMNVGLTKHVDLNGAAGSIWRAEAKFDV
jgi:hypothetical protein